MSKERKHSNMSGSYEDKTCMIIRNDPNQKVPKLNWINEASFNNELAQMRTRGKYENFIKAFAESSEKFAKIECENPTQAHMICQTFRNHIKRHRKNWKTRTHYKCVYVQKLN